VLPLAHATAVPLGGVRAVFDGVADIATSGILHCDISVDGVLAYAARDPLASRFELCWLAPDGTLETLALPPREYQTPRISPDGKRMVVGIGPGGGRASDLWVHDFERGSMTRLTFDEKSATPSWTDAGRRVVYASTGGGQGSFRIKLADGSDEGEPLAEFTDPLPRFPAGLTPDGQLLLFATQGTAGTASDILYWSRSDQSEHALARTSAGENFPALSPDGAWIAYVTDESGVRQVFVQAFPERSGRWQVSEGGGTCPVWSRDGRELFYVDGRRIRAVSLSTQPSFSSGPPRTVAELDFLPSSESLVNFDAAPDGRLLLVRGTSQASFDSHVNVVLGWGAALRRARRE
jgi:dipeptidyl aminopeptidase/acylaminoacyl peptidase